MTDEARARTLRWFISPTQLGLVGQVAAGWGAAGGLAAALVVVTHMLAGRLSASFGFTTLSVAFFVGSVLGFVHGAVVGYLGRPADVSRKVAVQRIAVGVVYVVPTMVIGWLVALALGMTAVAIRSLNLVALLIALVGWAATVVIVYWVIDETRQVLSNLEARWPDARAFLVVLGLGFLVLLPIFLATRPEIWVLGVRPTRTAAAIMALAATLWIGGPITTLVYLGRRARARNHSEAAS